MRIAVDATEVGLATWGQPVNPARPTVIWLHGAGMNHSVWTLQARAKPFHACNSLAPDLPGHGASAAEPPPSIAAASAWLLRLLDALGIGRASLVGHSMGALVALQTAATAARRVERLALLGAAARMPVHPALLQAAQADLPAAAAMIADWGIGTAAKLGAGGAPGVSLTTTARALLETSRPGVLASDLTACNDYHDGEARAAAVACPTLVICGAADRMTPAKQGQRLARLIPGARTITIPRAGHMMMLERPKEVLEALAGWMAAGCQ
jgi:pimeloyl-ACP methyl ester carboxylesterase